MAQKTFISYAFDDKEIVHSGKTFTQEHGGPVPGKLVRVQSDVSNQGPKAIDNEIKRVLGQCDAALFVVGNNNHNSPWIKREVELAISRGLPIVVARVPGTTGAVPEALIKQVKSEVSFTPGAIAAELQEVRKGGYPPSSQKGKKGKA